MVIARRRSYPAGARRLASSRNGPLILAGGAPATPAGGISQFHDGRRGRGPQSNASSATNLPAPRYLKRKSSSNAEPFPRQPETRRQPRGSDEDSRARGGSAAPGRVSATRSTERVARRRGASASPRHMIERLAVRRRLAHERPRRSSRQRPGTVSRVSKAGAAQSGLILNHCWAESRPAPSRRPDRGRASAPAG